MQAADVEEAQWAGERRRKHVLVGWWPEEEARAPGPAARGGACGRPDLERREVEGERVGERGKEKIREK